MGTRVAGIQATLDAAQVLLPGIFVVLVTWLGARFALDGEITPGELVAFYGYSAFLVMPLRTATEFVDRATRAHIGARKIIRVLAGRARHHGRRRTGDRAGRPGRPLTDPVSGVTVAPGRLTAVVSARPEESAALADRLGRFGPLRTPVLLDGVPLPTCRWRPSAAGSSSARPTRGCSPARCARSSTRRASTTTPRSCEALSVASGEDVLEALPAGLDSEVEERGRSFSGGQRQRLALARALLTDAETLVLVEPTSAVDAHTEARIAGRLAQARRGRTTVVMTASPLLLDHADEVLFLQDGRVAASGTHHELLTTCRPYRDTVVRGEDTA